MKETAAGLDVEFLKSYMKVKGYSESQFAEKIGVSHSYLNRVINGKRGAGKKVIFGVVANCTDVTMSQLINYAVVLPKGNKNSA